MSLLPLVSRHLPIRNTTNSILGIGQDTYQTGVDKLTKMCRFKYRKIRKYASLGFRYTYVEYKFLCVGIPILGVGIPILRISIPILGVGIPILGVTETS